MKFAKQKARVLLEKAGITINGSRDFDIQVFDDRFYRRVLLGGSLGLGESYMDGWWEVKSLDAFIAKVLTAQVDQAVEFSWPVLWSMFFSFALNLQSKTRAFMVGQKHYDVGNDLYEAMLGQSLAYSCGYWKNAQDLDSAQYAKFDLICKKIGLRPGQTVLDIGCGWGGFLKFAAQNYGIKGVGITVSKEQQALAQKLCAGLPIEIRLQDYRNVTGTFDRVVSVGMFEHVGVKNYRTYMQTVHKLLKDDGVFLLHTIGGNQSFFSGDPWLEKYIFPNGMTPSIAQIGKAIETLFVMEDWHNFGADYDKTLMAWFENFNKAWPRLQSKYGNRFYKMFKYYLLSCAGAFRSRKLQLWQVVLSKKGIAGGYESVR